MNTRYLLLTALSLLAMASLIAMRDRFDVAFAGTWAP